MGTFLIGRAANVDFRLDGALVSRQHAALDVTAERVILTDLASRNGVTVNGSAVQGTLQLDVGDAITIGTDVLRLVAAGAEEDSPRSIVRTSSRGAEMAAHLRPIVGDDRTSEADPLALLGSIVDRALAQGNVEEAEVLVSGHLTILLNTARADRRIKPAACAAATEYALKLARFAGGSRWVDYVFDLHNTARTVMNVRVVHELHALMPVARVSKKFLVTDYVRTLESMSELDAGPDRDLVLRRLRELIDTR